MTIMEFREHAMRLGQLTLDPLDKRDLELAIKNVAIYRTLGRVDEETIARLDEKYPASADEK